MRLVHVVGAGVLLLTAGPSDACRNNCDFIERCDGNVRQTCGGVDQCVGRALREEPCLAPNEACLAESNRARCVRVPVTSCDSTFVERCDGSLWLRCDLSLGDGFVVAQDCAETAGRACGLGAAGRSQCLSVP